LDIAVRLTPLLVMYALVIAAVFLPSFSLADEREKRTLVALSVSPARLPEVILAKGVLGFIVALTMAVLTLWLNQALTGDAAAMVIALVVAAVMLIEIGLIFGIAARTVTGVFTLIKGTAWLLVGPTVFYIFPEWPQWIAKLFPTYWVINPVFEVTIDGAGLGDVWAEELVALGFIAVLAIPMVLLVSRLRERLATE
jgi:ABC-2 type transport system permease protein